MSKFQMIEGLFGILGLCWAIVLFRLVRSELPARAGCLMSGGLFVGCWICAAIPIILLVFAIRGTRTKGSSPELEQKERKVRLVCVAIFVVDVIAAAIVNALA